jgi:hypothetical protein
MTVEDHVAGRLERQIAQMDLSLPAPARVRTFRRLSRSRLQRSPTLMRCRSLMLKATPSTCLGRGKGNLWITLAESTSEFSNPIRGSCRLWASRC